MIFAPPSKPSDITYLPIEGAAMKTLKDQISDTIRTETETDLMISGEEVDHLTDSIMDLLEPIGWEPGSLMDREGIAYNRESYFR